MEKRYATLLFMIMLFFIFITLAEASSGLNDTNGSENGKEPERQGEVEGLRPYGFKRLGYDTKYFFQRLVHLDKKDVRNICIFAGITGALYVERKDIREIVLRNKTDARMNIYEAARISGKAAFPPGVALVFLTEGAIRKSSYDIETSQIIMESFVLSGVLTGAGQFILATERPIYGDEIKFFHSGGHGVSGDVTISSCFVFPIIDRYLRVKDSDGTGMKIWKHTSQVFLFSLPVLTAMQRMSADMHWAPDVFLGAVSGLSAGKIVSNAHSQDQHKRAEISVSGGMLTVRF